jgi:hypothetical protein
MESLVGVSCSPELVQVRFFHPGDHASVEDRIGEE